MIPQFSLLLLLCLTATKIVAEDMKDLSIQQLLELAEDIAQFRPNDVVTSDVTFYLFTKESTVNQIRDSSKQLLDNTKKTKIIIHGWIENHKRSWYDRITSEYLSLGDYNVVQVDWERVARSSYISSAQNTKLVGEMVGHFIINQNLSLADTHIIGHSLGAHVAGFAAKTVQDNMGEKIKRITALDPAGPYFREFFITKNDRLSADDASIVDVIHTDGGFYGYEAPLGTLDIYVNGGKRVQPNCLEKLKIAPSVGELIEDSFCSHATSITFFTDIINRMKYTCIRCDSWDNFKRGECNKNEKYLLSAENIDETMEGSCFVLANAVKTPFRPLKFPLQLFDLKDIIRSPTRLL